MYQNKQDLKAQSNLKVLPKAERTAQTVKNNNNKKIPSYLTSSRGKLKQKKKCNKQQ